MRKLAPTLKSLAVRIGARFQLPLARAACHAHEAEAYKAECRRLTEELATFRAASTRRGSSFEHWESTSNLPPGKVFTYEEMLGAIQGAGETALGDQARPLVFIHVPKSAGTMLNNILSRNFRFRLDSFGDNVFEHCYPDEFYYYMDSPNFSDTRRPVFFTGHFGLANEIFQRLRGRYTTISMVRHPVDRMISNYRFHRRLPNNLWNEAIHRDNLSAWQFTERFAAEIPKQIDFFLRKNEFDSENRVDIATENLRNNISLFGVFEKNSEFMAMLGILLGLPNIFFRKPLNITKTNTTDEDRISDVDKRNLEQFLKEDIAFYNNALAIYQERASSFPVNIHEFVSKYENLNTEYRKLVTGIPDMIGREHPWTASYS